MSKSDVAVADPLESTLGEEFHGCSFLIVAQKALRLLLLLANLTKNSFLALQIQFTMELRRDLYLTRQS